MDADLSAMLQCISTMCTHTRPASILTVKLHSSLIPYRLTECSNHGSKLKPPVPKEAPTTTGIHHGWD